MRVSHRNTSNSMGCSYNELVVVAYVIRVVNASFGEIVTHVFPYTMKMIFQNVPLSDKS